MEDYDAFNSVEVDEEDSSTARVAVARRTRGVAAVPGTLPLASFRTRADPWIRATCFVLLWALASFALISVVDAIVALPCGLWVAVNAGIALNAAVETFARNRSPRPPVSGERARP